MKRYTVWDIFTGILLLGVVCLVCGFVVVLLRPTPLLAGSVQPIHTQVVIRVPTQTLAVAPKVFPPTWTPTSTREPAGQVQEQQPVRFNSTLEPTNTPYIAPTSTATPTNTPLPTATRADAKCYIAAETPLDNAEFQPNQEFTKTWTLRNNSGKTWDSSITDIHFVSGSRLQTGSDVYDLSRNVPQGGTVDFQVRMRAPSSANTYTGYWAMTADGEDLCKFFVKIVVK